MKRLGPELKMPPVKVPSVLRELYEDLRDRRLLPLLALLLVAIVAVPFLLGGDSGEDDEVVSAAPDPGVVAQASQLNVVEATPGLRDYRQRLGGRRETDPFEQRYTAPVLDGADLPESSESTSAGDSGEKPTSTSTSGKGEGSGSGGNSGSGESPSSESGSGGSGGGSGGGGNNGSGGGSKSSTWEVKLRVSNTEKTEGGKQKMGKPTIREQVRMLTPLPGKKNAVVTSLGVNSETRKALFMVSDQVTAISGDSRCVTGGADCELIELSPELPVVFEYGADHSRLKLQVVRVRLVG